ncbi:hypothetical protein SAMN02746093_01772 [Legionella quinlivanii DSM 21216]|nr:hypothetical protein SAMN02746093_01772 [Legionella quinlivanii DSM 21216]STY11519.1 Uncharacterised protein [Legionella quinlivanii]
MDNYVLDTYLGELSDEINKLYGYVKIAGDYFFRGISLKCLDPDV